MKYALVTLAGLGLAVSGFMVGRAHPAHHYQGSGKRYHAVDLQVDANTGKLCNPLLTAEEKASAANAALDQKVPATNAALDLSAGVVPEVQHARAEDYIPACGAE